MSLILLSFGAGVLTVLSPCVLPVLPFILARPGSGRLFGGLALGFVAVLLLATAGGAWAASVHGIGRGVALVLLAASGLGMAWPHLAERVLRPLQALAGRLDQRSAGGPAADWVLGLSTGLLWAPCAGPVLGVVLTGAALRGSDTPVVPALLAYAGGSVAMLGVVRFILGKTGQRLPRVVQRAVPLAGATRRFAGVAVLVAAAGVASGLDEELAVALPSLGLDRLEQAWLDRAAAPPSSTASPTPQAGATREAQEVSRHLAPPQPKAISFIDTAVDQGAFVRTATTAAAPNVSLPVLGPMPALQGASGWLQSRPLKPEDLRGKVVLVDFWTFGCINCQRTLPSVRTWARRYRDEGLVVIGVHAPEFAYERDRRNVERALQRFQLDYAIALDNDFTIWNAWSNQYWPTLYLVDAQGRVRWRHVGEGAYAETEQAIRQLLDEAKGTAQSS